MNSSLLLFIIAAVNCQKSIGGVTLAGLDFGVDIWGNRQGWYNNPNQGDIWHFSQQSVKLFRIPFSWHYIQPSLNGPLDEGYFGMFNGLVQAALSTGAQVIIDCHNYGHYNGQIIGQGGPTNDQFVDLWSKVASRFASNDKIIFGIMNEPHDMSMDLWSNTAQLAVNAIRNAGAKSQVILIPGDHFSSAEKFPDSFESLKGIVDFDGTNNLLLFDLHKYGDYDNSGRWWDCVTDNVQAFQTVYDLLKQNGRQAIVSETGSQPSQSCVELMRKQMQFISEKGDVFVSWVAWASGVNDGNSITPRPDGSDQIPWIYVFKPFI